MNRRPCSIVLSTVKLKWHRSFTKVQSAAPPENNGYFDRLKIPAEDYRWVWPSLVYHWRRKRYSAGCVIALFDKWYSSKIRNLRNRHDIYEKQLKVLVNFFPIFCLRYWLLRGYCIFPKYNFDSIVIDKRINRSKTNPIRQCLWIRKDCIMHYEIFSIPI